MFVQDANWNIYIDKEKNQPRLGFSKSQTRLVFFSSINEIFFTCNFKDNNIDFVQGLRDNRELK